MLKDRDMEISRRDIVTGERKRNLPVEMCEKRANPKTWHREKCENVSRKDRRRLPVKWQR
jgi:hypothetical protein